MFSFFDDFYNCVQKYSLIEHFCFAIDYTANTEGNGGGFVTERYKNTPEMYKNTSKGAFLYF